ncbi:UNVERIFIED_ORG: hypothetical protein GCAPEGMB_00461 [Vibrio phage V07]
MLYILDTTSMKLVATTDTMEQAEYLADLLVDAKSNPHIDDMGFAGLEVFSNAELATIYDHTTGSPIRNQRDRNDREFLVGLLLNLARDVKDERSVGALYGALGRVPTKPSKLPAAEPRAASNPRTSGTGERQSGAKERIFELADEAWKAAGSPTDLSVVLKLRKQWMNDWEALGIKKTTASSTLGAWQKSRLAS